MHKTHNTTQHNTAESQRSCTRRRRPSRRLLIPSSGAAGSVAGDCPCVRAAEHTQPLPSSYHHPAAPLLLVFLSVSSIRPSVRPSCPAPWSRSHVVSRWPRRNTHVARGRQVVYKRRHRTRCGRAGALVLLPGPSLLLRLGAAITKDWRSWRRVAPTWHGSAVCRTVKR